MDEDWKTIYADLVRRLPAMAARAPLTFCGNGACVDARVSVHNIGPMLSSDVPEAATFAAFLQDRARRGQGGEVTYDWPGGPAWIRDNLPTFHSVGGTAPHAAWVLSAVGAPALLALRHRSELMLGITAPDVLLAEDGGLVRAATARPGGPDPTVVHIFEYTAGRPIGAVVPRRSSRIIVKFEHFRLEDDREFDQESVRRARTAGAGLISGFSAVAASELPREAARVAELAHAWRREGLRTVHLELAGFDSAEALQAVLGSLRGVVTSVGMSLSELRGLFDGGPDLAEAMLAVADDLRVDRICVHADHWAASATRGDPGAERQSLLTGCLLASARAMAGRPVLPTDLDPRGEFRPLPFESNRRLPRGWSFVACASPFMESPVTTLGLGDTFTAGCLLALGASRDAA